jgi:O-antigen ligase
MAKKLRQNKNQGIEKTCLSIIKIGVYLILFTPLIVNRLSFFPFVTPKTIYFRILVDIILAFYIILALYIPRYRPKINFILISVFIFAAVMVLTSILGINFERSFWSTFERMTGIFTFFHLFAFLIIITSVFKKREDWDKILILSILTGVILCFHITAGSSVSSRGGGTVGNTSFMAAYLLFNIFFAIIFLLEKKTFGWRIFSGISLVIFFPILFASSARGATTAFFLGLFLIFMGYLVFSEKKKLRIIGISIILFLMALVIILAILQPPFVKGRIDKLLKEMNPRFVVWQKAWKGFLERPIFGWGPENFNVVFVKFFNPCMFIGSECGGEVWFDRAHNIVFDTLVTMGVAGLASYLFIFASAVFGLLKAYLKKREDTFPFLGIMSLLIIYFFQNLFVFDMISSYAIFFLTLGFACFLIQKEELSSEPVKELSDSAFKKFIQGKFGKYLIFILVAIFIVPVLYFGNIQPAFSAADVVKMILSNEGVAKKTELFEEALNTYMEKYEIREQFSQKIYESVFNSAEDKEALKTAFTIAEEQMAESTRENPIDFRPHLFLGRLYSGDYLATGDKEKLDLAEKTIQKSIELSPTNQQGYWYMTEVRSAQGNRQGSYDMFQKAIDLEPRLGLSHWYLAMDYKASKLYEKSLGKIIDAEEAGYQWKANLTDLKKGAEVYQILENDLSLVSIYEEGIKNFPEDPDLWAGLATSYANVGEFDKARETIMKVKELDPTSSDKVDKFLNSLPQ